MSTDQLKEDEFAIRCFLNGERILTSELSKEQAKCFLAAALHLTAYLSGTYGIDIKTVNMGDEPK